MDGFLHSNFTSPEQECVLLASDIGVDGNDETTAFQVQAGAREESARLPNGQQQGMTAWSTDQYRQFDRGRARVNSSILMSYGIPLPFASTYLPKVLRHQPDPSINLANAPASRAFAGISSSLPRHPMNSTVQYVNLSLIIHHYR